MNIIIEYVFHDHGMKICKQLLANVKFRGTVPTSFLLAINTMLKNSSLDL